MTCGLPDTRQMMMELCRHALSRSRESAGSIPARLRFQEFPRKWTEMYFTRTIQKKPRRRRRPWTNYRNIPILETITPTTAAQNHIWRKRAMPIWMILPEMRAAKTIRNLPVMSITGDSQDARDSRGVQSTSSGSWLQYSA